MAKYDYSKSKDFVEEISVVASSLTAVLAGKAEVSTSNLNGGSGTFDNLKASWGKALSIGDLKANLMAKYDYSKSKDFVEEISVTGDLMDDADLKVGYAVTRNFPNSATEVTVTATTKGTSVTALYDGELKEVSATRSVDVADRTVDLEPSYLIKTKTARVKLASMFGKDKVSATVDYGMDDASTTYEVGYAHSLEEGRSVTATIKPASTDLEVEYVDSTFEDGAVWTAVANLKTDDPTSLDKATVSLKRSWDW